jgi:hypothetical protein
MSLRRGRVRRPDDWPSSHVRARADLSERLDTTLEPAEASWLTDHLDTCSECRLIADEYATQRLELRALRDRTPTPPRDLWARTAAAIESESRFRDGRVPTAGWRDRRILAPSAAITAALVVVVAVAALTSSQRFGGGEATGSPLEVAAASGPPSSAAGASNPEPTRIPVTKKIAFVSRDSGGSFSITTKNVDSVCPGTSTTPCDDANATVDHPVDLDQNASTVFGSVDNKRLIVVSDPSSANSGSISVVPIGTDEPEATPAPTASAATASGITPPSAPPSGSTTAPSAPTSAPPRSLPPTPTPTAIVGGSPSPSVEVSPQPDGTIEIANDVVLVGQSAAYSPSGNWFAFTARPVNGTAGPDIFVWKVGDARARAVTTDHRSVFGSWTSDVMVGSTIVETTKGNGAARTNLQPVTYLLDPTTRAVTVLPQTGQAWRPAVDPTGRLAVYWAGTVRSTASSGYAPDTGRLVLGDWGAGISAPTDGPIPTPIKGDQGAARHETTLAAGRLEDWDARWDGTGTHLAVWIADPQNSAVGRLSLYVVDSFDGKIDLKKPLLDKKVAIAGYSIANGQLVWAAPAADGATTGDQIQLLAWTDEGVGTTVNTVTGPVIVIR